MKGLREIGKAESSKCSLDVVQRASSSSAIEKETVSMFAGAG